MTTRLINGVPMHFKLTQPIPSISRRIDPFWSTWIEGRIKLDRKDIGFGFSPFDAYIDFVGKMGAC